MLGPEGPPRHLCHEVADMSVRRWSEESGLEDSARDFDLEWKRRQTPNLDTLEGQAKWILDTDFSRRNRGESALDGLRACSRLPIGRAALAHDAERWGEPELYLFLPALPFDGHERAAFALRTDLDGTTVDIFGLDVLLPSDDTATDVYKIGDLERPTKGR